MTSNAVPPSVTFPSPNEWPQNLIKPITGITRNNQSAITSIAHGFTTADQGITFVMFKQVNGMIQINGKNALIQQVIDVNDFTVNIDTTNYHNYVSGGVAIVDSGEPPTQQQGFQIFNTPFQNIAEIN
jgi:hypothetical protein